MTGHVNVIGAGLAGLSAAMALVEAGRGVTLHEAGPAAGGRCRSYFDRALGLRIDNGNHLLLSGNVAAMAYLDRIGARNSMTGPGDALFPFMDLATAERWTVAPGAGWLPWWLLDRSRHVPGARLADLLSLAKLRFAGPTATVADTLGGTELYRRLLEPLAISALNTPPEQALARLMWAVVEGSLLKGGAACVPMMPRVGLSESFIDPAVAWLEARGAVLRVSHRISALEIEGRRVVSLRGPDGPVLIGPNDDIVLATPAWIAGDLLPELPTPLAFETIVNIHYRIGADPGPAGFIGLVGGMAEWIFIKPGVVSITISAANRLLNHSPDELAEQVWGEVRGALDLPGPMPPVRVVREKRATFAATAENERRRPVPRPPAAPANLAVAGDWTATGLPATIEGAIRSGLAAAKSLMPA